jgi:hypothetical protein
MSFNTAIYLGKATARAKSDVANKLISMFLHELSRKLSVKIGLAVTDRTYTQEVESIFGEACSYCGRHLEQDRAAVEHLDGMNRYRVGLHIVGNVVVACKRCNSEKRRDDSLTSLTLSNTGWESFLAHDGKKCGAGCKTCAYWQSIWPVEEQRDERLAFTVERLRLFRARFPKAVEYRERAERHLPEVLDTVYRDCQAYAASEIATAVTKALAVI